MYPPPGDGRRQRRVVLSLVVVLLCALAFSVSAVVASNGHSAALGPAAIPSPTDGDDPQVRVDYLGARADAMLEEHSDALLADDEAGWLEIFDESLHDDMSQQFDGLRAMEVSQYEYQRQHDPVERDTDRFEMRLAASYCFGGTVGEECAASTIVFDTMWADDDDGYRIVEVSESDQVGPRPWEVDDIKAVSGEKVIVAAPARYADELERALPEAEAAAENADQYAVYGEVEKYIIFLAGDAEFSKWYGLEGANMDNVVGFAMPVPMLGENGQLQQGGSEVVMHVDRVRDDVEFTSTMRHELGHVATLHHSPEHVPLEEDWWMVEGVAEVIDHGPETPLDGYLRKSDVAAYIDEDLWNNDLVPAFSGDDALTGSAKYGIAMYSVYYLFQEYGKDKFMDLFERVARKGEDPDASAQAVYGMSYDALVTECTDFVAEVAG
ncbi:hypothetical protein LX16_4161 [Stackebrandtia albiflava]|uniref:Peptidase MA superfamily protein n=2 Tax=Stackebrandtia albiflava TaxID=406432 RepID=A0A562UYQ0_9ACTN|nr:hypothetical protein LX16_4161 [Stackebrandtia albiflava]